MVVAWKRRETPEEVLRSVALWVERRARRSGTPFHYMQQFEGVLEEIRKRGLGEVVNKPRVWQDPLHVATEIEAVCAHRTARCWGSEQAS